MSDMVLVPREPTEAMVKAGRAAAQSADAHHVPWNEAAASVWTAMLSTAPPASVGWQPIETAPKDGTRVLVAVCGEVEAARWTNGGYGAWGWHNAYSEREDPYEGNRLDATHWMPLPTPPEGEW